MKKIFAFILSCLLASQAFSQSMPDGSFENNWTSKTSTFGQYWEYSSNLMGTLNALQELPGDPPPLTTQRETTNVYDGSIAVKLVSGLYVVGGTAEIFVPGAIGTISPDFVTEFLAEGGITTTRDFDFKPTSLTGFYKYTPVSGDSAAIDVALYSGSTKLASGIKIEKNTVSNWTPFNVPFTWVGGAQEPDAILLIFSSSAGYNFADLQQCKGQIGSTMWIDNVAFNYEGGLYEPIVPIVKTSVYPNPAVNEIKFNFNQEVNARLVIYNINGAIVSEKNVNELVYQYNTSDLGSGQYLFRLIDGNTILSSEIL